MSERATINQIAQLGIEVTPGTSVAATRQLQAISIEPAIKPTITNFAPNGAKFDTMAALSKEWSEAKISGQMAYNDLTYLLASLFNYAEPTLAGTSLAYQWSFAPDQFAPDTVKTYTIESGSSVRAGKFSYGLMNAFGFKLSRESFEVSGTMLGQAYQDGITLTSTGVTALDLVPMLATGCDIYLDEDSANLGNTQLTRALQASFDISDRFGPLWTINSSVSGYAGHVELKPKTTFKVMVAADSEGMGPLPAMRKGTKKFLRLSCTGDTIEDTITYAFNFDVCGLVTDVSEFQDQDGVYAVEWTFTPAYDATWGKAIAVDLTNTVDTL